MSGSTLGSGDMVVNKPQTALPSWSVHSTKKTEARKQEISKMCTSASKK